MGISWKTKSGLAPETILEKIAKSTIPSGENRITFIGFEFHESFPVLFSMLNFEENLSYETKSKLIMNTISLVAKTNAWTKEIFIKNLNKELSIHQAKKEIRYRLIVPINLPLPLLHKKYTYNGASITFYSDGCPSKYDDRNELFQAWNGYLSGRNLKIDANPPKYSISVINIKARTEHDAVNKGLDAIDHYRSILNLFTNSRMEFGKQSWDPINKIRPGGMYSLHYIDGKLASDNFWFDSDCVISDPSSINHEGRSTLKKNISYVDEQINKSPFAIEINKSLLRYVRSLDLTNSRTCLQNLWNTLESLAIQNGEKGDKIISRIKYLFKDHKYHGQVLEHLRECRNNLVHNGEDSGDFRDYCFQAQFYFYHFILFYLHKSSKLKSIQEVNHFLDLPSDLNKLHQHKLILEQKISFLTPTSNK